MLTLKRHGYTEMDLRKLQWILTQGLDAVCKCPVDYNCDHCDHKKVCSDVCKLTDYILSLLPKS